MCDVRILESDRKVTHKLPVCGSGCGVPQAVLLKPYQPQDRCVFCRARVTPLVPLPGHIVPASHSDQCVRALCSPCARHGCNGQNRGAAVRARNATSLSARLGGHRLLLVRRRVRVGPQRVLCLPRRDGNQLLGGGGVDGDDRVKVRLGRAHLHRQREALQDLVNGEADHVQPDHALLRAHADELREGLGHVLPVHQKLARVEHVDPGRLVHRHRVRTVPRDRLRLGESADRERRVRKHDGRNKVVVHQRVRLRGASKQPVRQQPARRDGGGREVDSADDVSERVDALARRARRRVDDDVPTRRRLDARSGQVEGARHRLTPRRKQHLPVPAALALPVFENDRLRGRVAADRLRLAAHDRDARRLHLPHQPLDHVRLHRAQRRRAPNEEVDLGAEHLQDPGELDGDVAGPDHGDAVGDGVELEEAVRSDAELCCARDVRDGGAAAHSDEH
mmetsp:Transcript_49928/g.161245  ORF Transcript_49928/g.161245 Transcript_49928/m.161245 type:complete len:450 (+) Transcript_49928:451-1800(+)